MKRILNYTLFFAVCFILLFSYTKADSCNYKEQAKLNKEAANIDYKYEFIKDDPNNYHFNIYITNIPEDLRLEIKNNYSKAKLSITAKDTQDGLYTIVTKTAKQRVKYSIDVYGNSGNCSGQLLYKKTITTPRYNIYSTSYICEQVPEFKYCGDFADTTKMTYSEFIQKAEKYKVQNAYYGSSQKKGFWQNILAFLNKYKWFLIVGVLTAGLIIGAIFLYRYLRIKKKGL